MRLLSTGSAANTPDVVNGVRLSRIHEAARCGMVEITPNAIKAEVAKARSYTLVVLRRGPRFDATSDIQMSHLQHVFGMRNAGEQLVTIPVTDSGEIVGIGLMATANKDEAAALMESDPGVAAGRFTYELLSCMAMPGDIVR